MGLLLQDLDLMVKTTMAIEREVDDAQSIRDAAVKDKRKESQPSSSSSRKKQRTATPQGFQRGCDYQGQGQGQSSQDGRHFRAPSQPGQRTCFYCYQLGHMKRDCPQGQGSMSYGVPQSQSSVRRSQTQFVPPYPTMG